MCNNQSLKTLILKDCGGVRWVEGRAARVHYPGERLLYQGRIGCGDVKEVDDEADL
jgi:hypothetical protein